MHHGGAGVVGGGEGAHLVACTHSQQAGRPGTSGWAQLPFFLVFGSGFLMLKQYSLFTTKPPSTPVVSTSTALG